jgi:hypothetical protein
MTPWKLPLIVAGISVPIVAAFFVGGGGVGLASGALMAVVIVAIAVHQRPQGPIDSAPAADSRRHVLLVAATAVEDPEAVAEVARAVGLDGGGDGGLEGGGDGGREDAEDVDVRVLAPARIRFLDRWASDVEPARRAAQANLVATVAALAKAGIKAEARVGDEDLVQAVLDQLHTFPATDVVLVSAAGDGEEDDAAVGELERRLRPEFRHVVL